MKSFTPKEIVTILIDHGFELVRTKGSHNVYVNRENGNRTVVPMHSKDLKKGTLHGILKQAGIDLKDYLKLNFVFNRLPNYYLFICGKFVVPLLIYNPRKQLTLINEYC
jgi:predicted RNA binding protein YcfA (HicA-like mRNA interferase family)